MKKAEIKETAAHLVRVLVTDPQTAEIFSRLSPERCESIKHHWQKAIEANLPAEAETPEITEKHLLFLRARGYTSSTVQEAVSFVKNLSPEQQAGFFADAEAWNPPPPQTAQPAAIEPETTNNAATEERPTDAEAELNPAAE
jgi:hypothetical protein